ncbi:ATP-binding protein [Kitasatospora sp. NPDC127060]|uniref:ATP-binding protein n=1 Tax=Kitasatospora sp. NPDC127060 TaxID=3347121 RepID=UPI00364ADA53
MESTTSTLTAASPHRLAAPPDAGLAPAPVDGVTYTFAAVTLEVVHRAHRAVTAYCLAGLAGTDDEIEAVGEAALIVDELMANVQRHAPGPADLVVTSEAGCWTVLVFDTSPRKPVPDTDEPGEKECGLGLHLITQLSESWGSFQTATGKAVWARYPKPTPDTVPQQHREQP